MPRIVYIKNQNSSETSAKREFSAVAILFTFAFLRTVVYHGIDNDWVANQNVAFVIDDGWVYTKTEYAWARKHVDNKILARNQGLNANLVLSLYGLGFDAKVT
jgi:hypothetical protein